MNRQTVSSDRHVIVVSYHDGSAVKGVYGPYENAEIAKRAMSRLQALPGMGDDKWETFPLHEMQPTSQRDPEDPPS